MITPSDNSLGSTLNRTGQPLLSDVKSVTDHNYTENPFNKPKGWGQRHTLVVLGFWGFAMSYAMRFNLSIAIVAMVKYPLNSLDEFDANSTSEIYCNAESKFSADEESKEDGEFYWDSEDQGLILASFFWGYVVTQIPGGVISTRFGGKWPLGIGLLISGILTILTPLAARTNVVMLIYVRLLQGLSQGMIFPAMQTILSSWSPPDERSQHASIVYPGCQFGAAMTMITSGYLIESSGGWPSVFYFTGAVTILWFGFWSYYVSNTPSENPWISERELSYIHASIGGQLSKEKVRTPWKAIFLSKPVWALLLAQIGHSWGLFTLLIELPTYFKAVLHFDMKQNRWLSALPPILTWLVANVITYLADYCISKNIFRTVTVRKICQSVSDTSSAFSIVGASLLSCNRSAAVSLLTFAVGISGGVVASFYPNQLEIACNHVGILMGISNTFSNFAGFGTAMAAGAITNDHSNQGNWGYVFYIAAGFYAMGVIAFLSLASSDEQSWNRSQECQEPQKSSQEDKSDDKS